VLRKSGLVVDEKEGRFVNYSLHPGIFQCDNPQATFMDLGWCRIEIPNI
jgi:ArsR family transcriptional regulator